MGLALVLHLLLAVRVPATGAQSGGAGGEALVTLQGAPEGMEELIQAWETPPDAQIDPDAPQPVEPEPLQPVARPEAEVEPPPVLPHLDVAEASPDTITVPKFDLEVPPPPRAPEEVPQEVPELAETPEPQPAEDQPEQVVDEAPRVAPVASLRPMQRPETPAPRVDAAPPPPPPAPEPERAPTPQARPADRTQQAREGGNGGVTQRAAGSGGSAQAGNAGNNRVAAGAGQQQAQLQAVWGAQIRSRIERRKRFPNAMRGRQGRVVVRLTVGRDGSILGASVARSSGQPAFDQAAIQAVQNTGRLPAAPDGLGAASYTFNLPMDFS